MNQKNKNKNNKFKGIDNYIIINSNNDHKKNIEYIDKYISSQKMIENISKPLIDTVEKIVKKKKKIIKDIIQMQINYAPFFKGVQQALEESKKDPDNLLNWIDYTEKLSYYIWTIPYKIDSGKLKDIFENVNSESEFDKKMRNYYKKEVVVNMIEEIKQLLPQKHLIIFKQLSEAYYNGMYSLSIIGMMSIIDDLCVFFLYDKSTSTRQNMFKPIIEDMDKSNGISSYLIDTMILSNNINVIYEYVDFNKRIKLKTKKKARRNPCQHGRSYSNRKTDAIMLLNTIYNLLLLQNNCYEYKNTIIYNKKKKLFYFKKGQDNS